MAEGSPYKPDYLRLLVNQKKIPAAKINDIWHITREALEEYTSKQEKNRIALVRKNAQVVSPKSPVENLGYLLNLQNEEVVEKVAKQKSPFLLEATLSALSLILALSAGLATLEQTSPMQARSLEATQQVASVAFLDFLDDSFNSIARGFGSLRDIALGRTQPVAEILAPIALTSQVEKPATFSPESLRLELESYIRTQISAVTSPVNVYPSTSSDQITNVYNYSYNPTILRDEILLADTRPTITRQSNSDAERRSSLFNSLSESGTFTNPTLTGATVSGPSGSFTSLSFTNATGTSLYLSGSAVVDGDLNIGSNTVTLGQLISTRIPTLPHTFAPSWPSGTSNASDATIYINPASADPDTNIFAAAVAGAVKFLVDAEGDVYANNLILSGSTSQGATTIAGNLIVQDNTTLGDAASDITTFTGQLLANASTTLQNFTFVNATGTNATTTSLFTTTASSTNLYSTSGNIGTLTSGSVTSDSATLINLLLTGSSTLQNFTFTNATGTSATTTNLFSTTASSTNLFSSLLSVGGTQGLNVVSGGNVGIGMTDPTQKLDVAGSLQITSTSGQSALFSTYKGSGSDGYNLWLGGGGQSSFSSGVFAEGSTTMEGSRNTAIGIRALNAITTGYQNIAVGRDAGYFVENGADNTTSNKSLYLGYNTRGSANGNTNEIIIGANAIGNGSNSVTLGDSSIATTVLRGNVGIGTTNPGSILDISSSNPLPRVTWTNTANYGAQYFFENSTAKSGIQTMGSTFATAARQNDLEIFTTGGDINFSVDTTATYAMSILGSGNVGIGDTTPGARLEINDTSATQYAARIFQDNATDSFGLLIDAGIDSGDYALRVRNRATTGELFAVRGDGNVGIGTTNPGAALHVKSSNVPNVLLKNGVGIGNAWIDIYDTADYGWRVGADDSPAGFHIFPISGSQGSFFINQSGNVGIGTTNPDHSLHIYGSGSSEFLEVQSTGADSNPHIQITNDARSYILQTVGARSDNFEIWDSTAGAARLVIESNGNVGIGTTDPTHPLHVYQSSGQRIALFENSSASTPLGVLINFTGSAPDNNSQFFLAAGDTSAAVRFVVYSDGDVQNHDNSYGGISDLRLKEHISDVGGYLDLLNQVKIKNFSFIEDHRDQANDIGVIAQEIEDLFPNLVTTNTSTGYKAVTYSKFTPMLIKAMQELDLKIEGPEGNFALSTLFSNIWEAVVTKLADVGNGITSLFAKEVYTEKLCIKKSDGTNICVTGDELQTLLAGSGFSGTQTSTPPPEPEVPIDSVVEVGGSDVVGSTSEAPTEPLVEEVVAPIEPIAPTTPEGSAGQATPQPPVEVVPEI